MFGSNAPFGGTPASLATNTGSTPAPSLFGNAAQTSSNTGSSAPNIFGGASFGTTLTGNPNTSTPLFGGQVATNAAGGNTAAPSLFGGAATGGTGSTPNLFGGTHGGGANNSTPAAAGSVATGTTPSLVGNAATTGTPSNVGTSGTPPSSFFSKPSGTTGTGTSGSVAAPSSFFSTPPATGATGPATSLFGNTAPSTNVGSFNTTSASAPSLFGKPADKKDGAVPTFPAFNLGGAATGEKKDGPATAPTVSLNMFGNKDTNAAVSEKKDATPAASSTSTLNLFGTAKPASTTPGEKKDATPAGSSVPAFSLFGNNDTAAFSTEKKDAASTFGLGTSTANKDNATTSTGFSLGSTAGTKDDKSKEASTSGSAAAPAASAAGTSTATTSNTAPAVSVPPPSMLRGKTIEEIVNRWSSDLDTHVREFNKFAGEVAVWDRALIENGNHLATLFAHVLAAEREQNDIDQALDHIEQQQRDLAVTLEAYEKSTDEILGERGNNLRALDTGPADTERDKNYMLATELHGHLDDLSGSLAQMIDAVNALALPSAASAPEGSEDPMAQIAQILNSHLESLLWIDGAAREVEAKIGDVERRVRAAGDGGLAASLRPRGFGLR